MAIITPGMGPKEISDNRKRGAWGHEHNVKAGTGTDQSTVLNTVLSSVVMPATGKDVGPYYFPPGKIGLSSTWIINRARGVKFQGVGYTRNATAPRNHNGSTNMSGTDLYWMGSAGGTVLEVRETNFATFEDFAVYLGNGVATNHAALGILWSNPSLFGHGRNNIHRVTVAAFDHGGTGMQFGESSGNLNIDTLYLERVQFAELTTCCRWQHLQGMEWTFNCPTISNCDTYFHFQQGGNFYAFGLQAQETRSGVEITVCKVDDGGSTQAHFHLYGGYIDRSGTDVKVTFFRSENSVLNGFYEVDGIGVRGISGTAIWDGTSPAYIEPSGGGRYAIKGCKLFDQPIVRWRTAADNGDRTVVTVRDTVVSDRLFGSELVTCLEGGYAGEVVFEDCGMQKAGGNNATHQSATVNRFPIIGTGRTHVDIDNFDATDRASNPTWGSSWLGGGKSSSPSWAGNLAGYYPFNESLGATLATDRVNLTGLDLTIDSDMQVPGPPMPYLDQWCDFNLSDSMHGRDTGIAVNPATQDLTIFAFVEVGPTISNGRSVASINVAGDSDFQICRTNGTSGQLVCGRSGTTLTAFQDARYYQPFFLVWTVDASADTWTVYINGCFVSSKTFAGYSGTASGTVYIGGRNTTIASNWCGRLSRVGIIKQHLTAKQATILSCQASVCAERRWFNPT